MTTDPDKQEPVDRGEQWSYAQIAAHLGVRESTVRGYASEGTMPARDGRIGGSPWWWESTIRAWRRPGQGARTDLKAHQQQ